MMTYRGILVFAALTWTFLLFMAAVSRSQQTFIPIPESAFPTAEEEEDIKRWIPIQCCRGNRCCFKVNMSALTPQPFDSWKVNASGQVLKRTGWTQDGQAWRCACDLQTNGTWLPHLTANTRCVFPIPMGY